MKPEIRYKNINLFTEKINYEKHKKKLQELSTRKTSFLNTQRISKLQVIKNRKKSTFLKQIQTRNDAIEKNNIKIFQKLASPVQKKIPQILNLSKLKQIKDMNPFRKKQLLQTQKQNLRIRDKIKSLASSINTKKIVQEYQKSEIIKNRIRKHDANSLQGSRKISVKIQKNLSFTQLPKSFYSEQSLKKDQSIISKRNQTVVKKLKINQQKLQSEFLSKNNSITERKYKNFYKKDEILKNKLNLKDQYQLQRRRKLSMMYRLNIRPLTQQIQTAQNNRIEIEDLKSKTMNVQQNNNQFFATQINKKISKTIQPRQQKQIVSN